MVRSANRVRDELLVLLAQDGDEQALEQLVERWRPRHYAHARRMLGHLDGAADAVQEAWIGILRGLGRIEDPARFPSWSYAIVTRRCQDALRRRRREPLGQPDIDPTDPHSDDFTRTYDLRRAIANLPPEQRTTIALYYTDGLSVSEIAEALGIPAGTVKSRLFHARRTLRRHFRGDHHDGPG